MVSSARQSTDLVDHIAESAEQQAETLRQLTEGMENISAVVQTNAATAEESASSACELSQQAEKLQAASGISGSGRDDGVLSSCLCLWPQCRKTAAAGRRQSRAKSSFLQAHRDAGQTMSGLARPSFTLPQLIDFL